MKLKTRFGSKLPSTENVNLMMIIQDTVVVQDPEMKELVCLPLFLAILNCLPDENVQGGKKLGGDFEPSEGARSQQGRFEPETGVLVKDDTGMIMMTKTMEMTTNLTNTSSPDGATRGEDVEAKRGVEAGGAHDTGR